jgi:hypothetical protein
MKKQKSKDDFWFVLAIINILAIAYPTSLCLCAVGLEDRILAVSVLCGVGLLLAIIDGISIMVVYSQ